MNISQYYTYGDDDRFARCEDVAAVNEVAAMALKTAEEVRSEFGWIADSYGVAIGSPEECSTYNVGGTVGCKIDYIESEIAQIKEVLLELQMTLRTLGLDDMSRRLGDLNLLLT